MIATVDTEFTSNIRISSLLDVLHMSSVDSNRNIVFRFASDGTSMATDTLPVVYNEAVIDHGPPSMRADRPSWQMSLRHITTEDLLSLQRQPRFQLPIQCCLQKSPSAPYRLDFSRTRINCPNVGMPEHHLLLEG